MNTPRIVSCALLASLTGPLGAQHAPQQLFERTATVSIGVVKTNDNQTHNWGGARVLQADVAAPFGVLDAADRVYMYVTGVNLLADPCTRRDELWLYQNLNTRQEWSSVYNEAPPVRILPKPDAQCTGCTGLGCVGCKSWGDYLYGTHWPYKWNGKYYMVVSASSPNATACVTNSDFFQVLLGVSNDGITWTFRPFIKTSPEQALPSITWKEVAIGGTPYHWGFTNPDNLLPGQRGLGGIRFKHVASPCSNSPWCFSSSGALEVWSTGQWVSVPSCQSIGDTSGYDYCLYTNPANPGGSRINLDFIPGEGQSVSLHRLAQHGGIYELWTHGEASPKPNCCQVNGNAAAMQLRYRQVFPPTTLTQTLQSTLGPILNLQEGAVAVRCQPGGQAQSRYSPFRLEWAADMLYSRTTDNSTNPFVCPRETHYVVRTFLGNN